jgi:hypothetical protein
MEINIQAKPFWQSKTLWLAIIQAVVGVFAVVSTSYPTLGWIVVAKSILDVILREVTNQPIA